MAPYDSMSAHCKLRRSEVIVLVVLHSRHEIRYLWVPNHNAHINWTCKSVNLIEGRSNGFNCSFLWTYLHIKAIFSIPYSDLLVKSSLRDPTKVLKFPSISWNLAFPSTRDDNRDPDNGKSRIVVPTKLGPVHCCPLHASKSKWSASYAVNRTSLHLSRKRKNTSCGYTLLKFHGGTSKRETQTAVTITLIKFRPRFSLSNTIEDRR